MAATAYARLCAEWERRKEAICIEAHAAMMRDPARFFLYFTPSAGATWGEFYLRREDADVPAGAEPVTPEAIPPAELRAIQRWLERFAGRLPMLPTD